MPPESGKALLFDIDGTLADTDALHVQAFNHVFGPRSCLRSRTRVKGAYGVFHRFDQRTVSAG